MDEAPQTHKRKPLISFLLSIWTPGLGQLYNGQFTKGMLVLGLTLLCYTLITVFNLAAHFYGFLFLGPGVILIRIYGAIDAVAWSIKQRKFTLKKYNNTGFYIAYAIITFGISATVVYGGLIGSNMYTIQTTGNSPTIKAGDYVIINNRAYNSAEVRCGDIVGFTNAEGSVYTSRVIGTPNDVLSIYKNTLTINGKKATYKPLKKEKSQDKIKVARYEEVLPNGVKHDIYMNIDPNRPGDSTKQTIANIVVPPGHYYVMGDNRDNALDSRYTGPLAEEDIIGQLVYVLWGEGGKRMNINLRPQTK